MRLRKICLILLALLITGCAKADLKPNFISTTHDPVLDEGGGPLLVSDVCIKIDVLGDDDYFIVEESRSVANALLTEMKDYLSIYGIESNLAFIPFVCGNLYGVENSPKKFSDHLDAEIQEGPQPLAITDEMKSDKAYLNSLSKCSTFVFQNAVKNALMSEEKNNPKINSIKNLELSVSKEDFKDAAAVIADRTHRKRAVFIGLMGNKLSTGKKVARSALNITVGTAVGIASAGIIPTIPVGQGYVLQPYLLVFPSGDVDHWQMAAGMVDLESGELLWSKVINAPGDPTESKALTHILTMDLLLNELVRKPAQEWTPPGSINKELIDG